MVLAFAAPFLPIRPKSSYVPPCRKNKMTNSIQVVPWVSLGAMTHDLSAKIVKIFLDPWSISANTSGGWL